MSAISSGKITLTNEQALKIIELRKKSNKVNCSKNKITLTNEQALKIIKLRNKKI